MNKITEDGVGVLIAGDAQTVVGFHGATRRPQRSGAIQAAVTATATALTGTLTGTANGALVDVAALIVLVNELRAALTEKGLIKGEA